MTRVAAVAILLTIVMMFAVTAFNSAYVDGGNDIEHFNETWEPNTSTAVALTDSNLTRGHYDDDVTVYDLNATNTTTDDFEVRQENNFTWHTTNGTVTALSGGELDGDPNATITYELQRTTGSQQRYLSVFGGLLGDVGAYLPLVVLFAAFVAAAKAWSV